MELDVLCCIPCGYSNTFKAYLDVGPPVPLGASDDEKSRTIPAADDPAGSRPADTHLCLLRYPCYVFFGFPSSVVFWYPVCCCMVGISICSNMSWIHSMSALLITSSYVAWLRREMARNVRRQRRCKHGRPLSSASGTRQLPRGSQWLCRYVAL